jgi:hypothetical protein
MKQGDRLVRVKYIEWEGAYAVQAGQPASARDEGEAPGAGRKQRADLIGGSGIVQQQQDPPTGQLASPQRHTSIKPIGNPLPRDPELAKEGVQGHRHLDRGTVAVPV